MIYAITILTIFSVLIIEIPFNISVDISINNMSIKYVLKSPIKQSGYIHLKTNSNNKSTPFLALIKDKIIIKTLAIHGEFSDYQIETTIMESVAFSALANVALDIAYKNNQFATLSKTQTISQTEENEILLETTFWLSIFDIAQVATIYAYNKIKEKLNGI